MGCCVYLIGWGGYEVVVMCVDGVFVDLVGLIVGEVFW